MLLAIGCCLSAVNAQWLEKTIALSDSFGDIWPVAVYYVPSSNCVYAAGEDDDVGVIDAATNVRVARIGLDEPMFMAFDSQDNKVYMTSRDSLAVIDPVTNQVLRQLDVGQNPTRLCYNPTANKVYCIAGERRDSAVVLDCSTDSVLARIWVGRTDYDFASVCCNPVGNKVYVSSYEEGDVKVIDGAGDALITTIFVGDEPVVLTYSPVSNKLYCALFDGDEVAVIDAGPDTVLKFIELDESPLALGYNPVSDKVYCGDCDGYVHVVDCTADTILASLDLATGDPMFFVFDSVDNQVFCFPDYGQFVPVISGTSDTIVGSVGISVDVYYPDPACYDPQRNRLYIRGRSSSDVIAVDATSREVVAAVPMSVAPLDGTYIESLDKLYCSDEESGLIAVINCATDSLERRILTPAHELGTPVYSSVSNKLYYTAYLNNGSGLVVVDCAGDSFEAALPVQTDMTATMVYNPAMDRIYWYGMFEDTTILVVDCAGDSIVARVQVGGYPTALACNPDSNRVYCAANHGDSAFISAIDCAADTVIGAVRTHANTSSGDLLCYVPSRDAVVAKGPDANLVVVDGAARQVTDTIRLPDYTWGLELSPGLNKLYCFLAKSDLAVIDCRDWSLRATLRLARGPGGIAFDTVAERVYVTSPDGHCLSLVDGRTNQFLGLMDAGDSPGDITWVPQHRKMYVVDQDGQAILVVRDTSLAGFAGASAFTQSGTMPTIVRGVLFLPKSASPSSNFLMDISGRKVLDLLPGANDVRALAPGVYFIRGPKTEDERPGVVRKVVLTR